MKPLGDVQRKSPTKNENVKIQKTVLLACIIIKKRTHLQLLRKDFGNLYDIYTQQLT